MFDHLLESSHRDDSNKWPNIGFGEEIKQIQLIEVHFTHLIWSSDKTLYTTRFSESQGENLTMSDGLAARHLCIRVTPEQEAAVDAFFQINNWTLIKEGEQTSVPNCIKHFYWLIRLLWPIRFDVKPD